MEFSISSISADNAPRPPLSEKEVEVVTGLKHAFQATNSTFCCTGHAPFDVKRPVIFYATTSAIFATNEKPDGTPISTRYVYLVNFGATTDTLRVSALDLFSPTADYAAFHNACLPAHFGHGKELVYDETYRLAREIRPEAFGLNFDPIVPSNGILSEISRLIAISIRAELYKINSYGHGGMFHAHQDTPRGDNHIGTLVVAFPSAFEGGEFVLRKSGGETVLDWSTAGRAAHSNELHWVFFYSDIEHEILPVKTGYRVTISYNIYGVTSVAASSSTQLPPASGNGIEFKLTPFFSSFVAAYQNPDFLPKGGRLAFGLDHEYGLAGKTGKVTNIDGLYKGTDAALVSTLKETGLPYSFKAVYQVPQHDDWDEYGPDEFSTVSGEDVFLVWDSFSG